MEPLIRDAFDPSDFNKAIIENGRAKNVNTSLIIGGVLITVAMLAIRLHLSNKQIVIGLKENSKPR